MRLAFRWCHARLRLGLAVAAGCALFGAVAAAPASAHTSAAEPSALSLPPGGIGQVSAPNLDELLGEGELGSGGLPLSALEAPLLAKQLSRLPGITALSTVNGLGGNAGVEQAMLRAIEQLAGEGELVEELVGGFGLAFDFEEQLEETYEAFSTAHEGAPESLEEAVEEALGRSPEELIEEGLESLTLGELLSKLVGKAEHPKALVQALFSAADQEEVQELLGSALTGEPFSQATVAEAAAAIGITSLELAEKLGKTSGQLPEASLALFAALENGQQLGVFAAKQGLAFGLVGEAPPVEEEPEEAEEEEIQGAGTAPPTKNASSNSPSGLDAQNALSATAAASSSGATGNTSTIPQAPAPATVAKVRVLGHTVSHGLVTLAVQVTGAGRLSVSGHGVSPVHRKIARAGRVSIKLHITRSAAASLHRHHRLKLALLASFASGSGPTSITASTITLA